MLIQIQLYMKRRKLPDAIDIETMAVDSGITAANLLVLSTLLCCRRLVGLNTDIEVVDS
jgi:hypothetical protein